MRLLYTPYDYEYSAGAIHAAIFGDEKYHFVIVLKGLLLACPGFGRKLVAVLVSPVSRYLVLFMKRQQLVLAEMFHWRLLFSVPMLAAARSLDGRPCRNPERLAVIVCARARAFLDS